MLAIQDSPSRWASWSSRTTAGLSSINSRLHAARASFACVWSSASSPARSRKDVLDRSSNSRAGWIRQCRASAVNRCSNSGAVLWSSIPYTRSRVAPVGSCSARTVNNAFAGRFGDGDPRGRCAGADPSTSLSPVAALPDGWLRPARLSLFCFSTMTVVRRTRTRWCRSFWPAAMPPARRPGGLPRCWPAIVL